MQWQYAAHVMKMMVHWSLVMFEGECGCDVMDAVVMLWSSSSGSCHVERGMM
jgi:hypothetical protein